jgi:hypothetical protein
MEDLTNKLIEILSGLLVSNQSNSEMIKRIREELERLGLKVNEDGSIQR